MKVLKRIVLDNPEKEKLTLWSDSCVPQNRNSYMSAAIQEFLNSNHSGNLQIIDHKYSEAGHGEVQNVDCAHSIIEKFLRGKFIYSPVSLIKEFHKIPPGKSEFVILEMDDSDYFDYEKLAQASKYSVIPYKKVVQLTYKKNQSEISYKLGFSESFIQTDIVLKQNYTMIPELQELELHSTITAGKMADIQKMYGIMPEIDRIYYQNGFKKIMGKLSPEALTVITKKRSDVDDENECPNTSHLVTKSIKEPQKNKKVTVKTARTTGNSNRRRKQPEIQEADVAESEVDHLEESKSSKNVDTVQCDKNVVISKSSGHTAKAICAGPQTEKCNNLAAIECVTNSRKPKTSNRMAESSVKRFGRQENSNKAGELGSFADQSEDPKSKPQLMAGKNVKGSKQFEHTHNGTEKLMPRNNRKTGFQVLAATMVNSLQTSLNKSWVRKISFSDF